MSHAPAAVPWAQLFVTAMIVNVYVQLSELVRYLAVVQPRLQTELSMIEGVGGIDTTIFPIWGLWGTLLSITIVAIYWLCANATGPTIGSAVVAGTLSWAMSFVILWVGIANMEISSWNLPAIALPLALVETITASLFARWLLARRDVASPRTRNVNVQATR